MEKRNVKKNVKKNVKSRVENGATSTENVDSLVRVEKSLACWPA